MLLRRHYKNKSVEKEPTVEDKKVEKHEAESKPQKKAKKPKEKVGE